MIYTNHRMKYPASYVNIRLSKRIIVPDHIIETTPSLTKSVYIKKDNLHLILKSNPKESPKTVESLINTKPFLDVLDKITPEIYKELQHIRKNQFDYNEVFLIRTVAQLIKNGISNKFVDRLRILKNIKATDSRAVKILKFGITEGLNQHRIKSDRYRGKNNPAYNHGGKFSPFSKNFIYADTTPISDITDKCNKTKLKNKSNTTTLEYYTHRGSTEEEAQNLLKNRQTTFSKDKLVEKYGYKKGLEIWQTRQDKWQDTLTSKSQEEINTINKKKQNFGGYSNISQELFDSLNIENARYATRNGEYRIKLASGKHISFDFLFKDRVIEFYGDFWHMNPEKYRPTDFNIFRRVKKVANDVWAYDKTRISEINKLGFKTFVVWEHDYNKSKQSVITNCLEFLYD